MDTFFLNTEQAVAVGCVARVAHRLSLKYAGHECVSAASYVPDRKTSNIKKDKFVPRTVGYTPREIPKEWKRGGYILNFYYVLFSIPLPR